MAEKKITVQRGQTLSQIAKANNTTVAAIKASNPKLLTDPKYKGGNVVFAGTTLRLAPKAPTPAVVPTFNMGQFRLAESKDMPITATTPVTTRATTTATTAAVTTPVTTVITEPTTTVITTDITELPIENVRTLARDTFRNTLALFFGAGEAGKPWMDALYDVVSRYYRTGSSAEESYNLALQEARTNPTLKPFADRFKGIYALQDMRQQGRPVLVPTIAEYVVSQAKMGDILTQAGLGNLANEEFTGELIGKGNSVSTVADKVAQVFARIDLAPKAIKDTLSRYFPTVDRATLAKTILTGAKGTQELVDELAQYEVLAAAEQQGLGVSPTRPGGLGLDRAREYARLGETYGSITPKLARVAQATPTVSKLAGISGTADIGQAGIEKAVITSSAKELEELQRLSEQEEARFRGQSGMANLGLASQRRANRAF